MSGVEFQTPSEDDLDEVDPDLADALADDLGDDLHQGPEHPYDPAGDPDSEPKDSQPKASDEELQRHPGERPFDALRSSGQASTELDGGAPAAQPRAGG